MPVSLNGATSGSVTITAPAVAGTNTLTLPAVTDTLVGLAATQTLTGKTLTSPTITGAVLSAGTTTVAPLDFTSGTNLTTALAGAMEYDGKVFYGTPQGTQRGIIPGAQFFRLNSNLGGSDVNTVQSVFGVSVTLSASTVYAFEGVYLFSKTAGATNHSIGTGFGGSATLNNIGYSSQGVLSSVNPISTSNFGNFLGTTATATAVTGVVSGSATLFSILQLKGTVSINGGGTFTPQYILSNPPGGAYSTVAGSYFLIYPIGASGSNTSVGTWA
jgi:hypothetical protein